MPFLKISIIVFAACALLVGQGAFAHETKHQGGATQAGSPASLRQSEIRLTVTVDLNATAPSQIQITRGARVHLSILGAGENALHLHGYDIEVHAVPGQSSIFIFDALHARRFRVEMHVADDFLGRTERAVLYIEVRDP